MSFSTSLLDDCVLPTKFSKLLGVPYPKLFHVLLCMVKTLVYCKQVYQSDLYRFNLDWQYFVFLHFLGHS